MKTINNNIISFIGEIIFKFELEKEFLDIEKDKESNSMLERTLNLFFNDKVVERKKRGENPIDFHPLSKLTVIIDNLINNRTFFEELPFIVEEDLGVSLEDALEISSMIENNQEIKNLIEEEDVPEEDFESKEKREQIIKNKSIASEFLK
ncbi:MAG: hypothetical protein WC446_01060 [Candidatus Paceibacterota bacterium]|jgi:hypothetical protein